MANTRGRGSRLSMESRLKCAFLASHAQLVRRLELRSVLPHLVSEDVVTLEEKERIQNEASSERRVDKLLTAVHRRGVNDPAIYSRLLYVLKDPEATSGQKYLQEIVKKIEEDSRNEDIQKRFAEASEERHVAALRKHESAILSVDVHQVLPSLMSDGVITPKENEDIRSVSVELGERAGKLLISSLQTKGLFGFQRFVVALHESGCYQRLVEQLAEGVPNLAALVRSERGVRDDMTGHPPNVATDETDGTYLWSTDKIG